jgi:hypothetical protein
VCVRRAARERPRQRRSLVGYPMSTRRSVQLVPRLPGMESLFRLPAELREMCPTGRSEVAWGDEMENLDGVAGSRVGVGGPV